MSLRQGCGLDLAPRCCARAYGSVVQERISRCTQGLRPGLLSCAPAGLVNPFGVDAFVLRGSVG